jgi:hypothetical protein
MSDTQARLDAYLAAELRILAQGQSLRLSERQLQNAELETIRKAIVQLKRELAAESGAATGGSLRYRTAVFGKGGQ